MERKAEDRENRGSRIRLSQFPGPGNDDSGYRRVETEQRLMVRFARLDGRGARSHMLR